MEPMHRQHYERDEPILVPPQEARTTLMAFDLQRARDDTPGCKNVTHFNNAGASLMPKPVLDATIAHLQLEAQIGGYEAAERSHDAVEHTYDAAAALIGCSR